MTYRHYFSTWIQNVPLGVVQLSQRN